MLTNKFTLIGGTAVAVAIVASVIFYLQSFDASKVACEDTAQARSQLQAAYDQGVAASVEVYADEKAEIDERLSQCLSAKPVDPCADAQKARDAAVAGFEGISSPADNAPYAEFQTYFKKRDDAYNAYKSAKNTLDQCRAANPPKPDVPYEKSDTKACFDTYDASVNSIRDTFDRNTQTMRAALKAAFADLDAREKACHPPTGKEKFTQPPTVTGSTGETQTAVAIANCRSLNADLDSDLLSLRQRAAALPGEIAAAQTSIDNIKKRMSPLQQHLKDVDTYIPPESTRTQFEGALNALRAERKVALEADLAFYKNMLAKKQEEKSKLEQELKDTQAKIAARLEQIRKENETRQRAFPTAIHQAPPDECAYYHCHGMMCGIPDPDPHGCGHGATTQEDTECKQFLDAYLKAAGI